MPDPIVAADALPAGSSPAADLSPVVADADPLESLSAADLQTWRETGALPQSPVTDAAAASSPAPVVQDPPVSTETPAQAASEPADPPVHAKTKARMDELLADRTRERERADRLEQRNRDLERQRTAPPPADARPAASSAAAAALVAPDPETFPYGTADPGYLKALTAHTVATTLAAERATWDEGQRQARVRAETDRVMTAFEQKTAEARTKHPDFDAVALQAPTEIQQGSATDLFILEDPAGADVLYHLQQPANTAERRRILALAPLDQLKALVRLGDRLTTGAPAPSSTKAPPPPPTLSTRATPSDPVERAWALGDSDEATGAIIAAENARELARLKR